MNKYEVLISESVGVVVEVYAESLEQAEEDAMCYAVLDNAKEVKRIQSEDTYVIDSIQLEEKE